MNQLIKTLTYKIIDCIIDQEKSYILIDSLGLGSDRNILCYTNDGNILWQIEKMEPISFRNYYSAIYLENENLFAYNVSGIEVELNKENGKIIRKELIK